MKTHIVSYLFTAAIALACLTHCHHLELPTGKPERLAYHIHSVSSGRLLAVFRGGRVHANATSTNRNTRFFVSSNYGGTISSSTTTFRSVKFRDRYLVMDMEKNKLRLGYPKDGNHRFEVLLTRSSIHIVLRDSRGCYIGFSSSGKLLEPCGLKSSDRAVLLSLRIVEKNKKP